MKARTVGQKRRNKRQRAAPAQSTHVGVADGVRPTPERRARGRWADPTGIDKAARPAVDMASDMIGALHMAERITDAQEQAARQFQRARAAYLSELPGIEGYKSCIAGGVPGYDDGDGDPAVIEAYRRLETVLDRVRARAEVVRVCEEGRRPANIDVLRVGLDAIAGA